MVVLCVYHAAVSRILFSHVMEEQFLLVRPHHSPSHHHPLTHSLTHFSKTRYTIKMDFFLKEKHAYVPIGSSGSEGVSGRGGQSQQLPLHVGVGSKGGSEGVSEGVSAARLGKIFGLVGVTLFLLSMLLTSSSPSLSDGVSDGVSGGVGVENEGE
jgi:hypothetical protein